MRSPHHLYEWHTTESCPHKGARDSSVSMGPGALAHKGKVCSTAPQRAEDDESGASWIGPWGKASLLLLIRRWHERMPRRSSLPVVRTA
jgi:hypothetical protein